MMIELHRRTGDDWQVEIFSEPEERCTFESVGLTMSLSDVYRNVRFDEAAET